VPGPLRGDVPRAPFAAASPFALMHFLEPAAPATFDPLRFAPLRHDFHRHPLLQFDALADLARRLMPHGKCRFLRPGTRQDSSFDHEPKSPDGRALDEVLASFTTPGSWLALYDAQIDAQYRQVLAEVGEHIRRIVAPSQTVHDVRSFLFLSAPPSVTPFHIDRENNFWLQIRGKKTLTLWDHRDRAVVPAEDVEQFILKGDLTNVRLRDGMLARGTRFRCGPGDGVYFPSTTPHMTESTPDDDDGDALCISVGMVFYTNVTRRDARAHLFNRQLRRLGLAPRSPGGSAVRDTIKGAVATGLRPLRHLRRLFR
jgi:hypothetical protein